VASEPEQKSLFSDRVVRTVSDASMNTAQSDAHTWSIGRLMQRMRPAVSDDTAYRKQSSLKVCKVDFERLEKKFGIPEFAVEQIALKVAMLKRDESGCVSRSSLKLLLQDLISHTLPDDFVTQSLRHFNSFEDLDCEKVLAWYVREPLAEYKLQETKKALMDRYDLSAEKMDEITLLFESLKLDDSGGQIDFKDIQGVVKSMVSKCGISREHAHDVSNEIKWSWVALHSNGDGGVDLSEFVSWYQMSFGEDGLMAKAVRMHRDQCEECQQATASGHDESNAKPRKPRRATFPSAPDGLPRLLGQLDDQPSTSSSREVRRRHYGAQRADSACELQGHGGS